ncbi:MAG TPA: carbon-nitrogen hydrolase family protein [Aggregatilineaceae bacterium]|nr:carbon-nitrogen hydrolase family protein [Aggregatilineaceae bacterium]
MKLRVALLQMNPEETLHANQIKGELYCRQAAALGADIALFPEMWSNGYRFPVLTDPAAVERWQSQAISRDHPLIEHFQNLARELNLAIAITYLETWYGGPRNSLSLIDRHGEILFTYAKVHTCEWGVEALLTPGDSFYVETLDTASGPVKVGAMICYDRESPEPARILMLQGAEVILVPNACTIEENRITQLRTRAYENMVAVALANYAAPAEKGHSIAFDGMAFDANEQSLNMKVIEAGEEEGVYLAVFDLDKLRAYRASEVWGNAYRKPRAYGMLVSEQVEPPFVRPDSRR